MTLEQYLQELTKEEERSKHSLLVHLSALNGEEMECEIITWHDLGIEIKLPEMDLAEKTQAEILIVRGDGVATNPQALELGPAS